MRPGQRRKTFLAQVDAGAGIARHRQPEQVGHRAAIGQRAARCRRQSDHLDQPAHNLLVDEGGGMVAAPDIGTLHRGQKIRQGAGKTAGAHEP